MYIKLSSSFHIVRSLHSTAVRHRKSLFFSEVNVKRIKLGNGHFFKVDF